MNLYNEFKNIENRLAGKEPTIHGGTYYFAVYRLDKSDDIILSLKDYFLKLEAVNEEDEMIHQLLIILMKTLRKYVMIGISKRY